MTRKKNNDISKNFFRDWPLLFLAVVIFGALGVAAVRSCQNKLFPVTPPQTATLRNLEAWVFAVRNGKMGKALLLANRFVDSENVEVPDPDYIKFVADMGLSTLVLTEKFNRYDFIQWKDALEINDLIKTRNPEKEITVEEIYKRVFSKIIYRKSELSEIPSFSAMEVWRRGYGNSHEISRLLCGMASQAGYSVQTVSLFDNEGNFLHLLCEFRKGASSAVIDPRYMKLWNGFSVADLADPKNSEQLKDWQGPAECLEKRLYALPAEVRDYRIYNQKFFKKLKSLDKNNSIPFFGSDPRKSIDDYLEKYHKDPYTGNFTYWKYPFYVLTSQPDYPVDWRLKTEEKKE